MNETQPANPSAEPSTFRERKLQQLAQERQARQPELLGESSAEVEETTTRHRDTQSELLEESEDQTESLDESDALQHDDEDEDDADEASEEGEIDAEESDSDESPEVQKLRAEVAELRQLRDEAEEARQNFERDYRRKTHNLGEQRRANDQERERLAAFGNAQLQIAASEVEQYQQIDWNALQQDPQKYQQLQAGYQQALNKFNAVKTQGEQAQALFAQQLEHEKRQAANIGREVLQAVIPGWGPDRYKEIQEFAVREYDLTAEEINDITDWRIMLALEDARKAKKLKRSASKTIKRVGKQSGRKRPAKRTAVTGQKRNARGQYESARDRAVSRPGDRKSFREMKEAQLKLERSRR